MSTDTKPTSPHPHRDCLDIAAILRLLMWGLETCAECYNCTLLLVSYWLPFSSSEQTIITGNSDTYNHYRKHGWLFWQIDYCTRLMLVPQWKTLRNFTVQKTKRGVRDQETCDVICGQPLTIAGREEKFRDIFWWSGLFLWIVQFILTAAQGASVASFSRLSPLKWCETATSQ